MHVQTMAACPMLTRSQVARRIGKSIATVRRLEGHELHPKVGPRGVHLFCEDEVAAFAAEVLESGRALFPNQRTIPDNDGPSWEQYDELQGDLEDAQAECRSLRTLLDESAAQADANERELQRLRIDIRDWATIVDQACALFVQANTEEIQAMAVDGLIAIMQNVPE